MGSEIRWGVDGIEVIILILTCMRAMRIEKWEGVGGGLGRVLGHGLMVGWMLAGFVLKGAAGESVSSQPALTRQVPFLPWTGTNPVPRKDPLMEGDAEKLARAVCGACHLFPEPDLLDRTTWRQETLPRMAIRLGLSPESVEVHPERDLLKATGRFPEQPWVSRSDFDQIVNFYLGKAPEVPIPQPRRGEIHVGLSGFEVVKPDRRSGAAATTLVRILEADGEVVVGDALTRTLEIYDGGGKWIRKWEVGNVPVGFGLEGGRALVSMIGSFYPSERRQGAVVEMRRVERGRWETVGTLLAELPRTVDVGVGDLNMDGRADLVVCMFGNVQGRVSWFESGSDGGWKEHVLLEKSGAVRCVVRDFNGDGRQDVAVLVAQETEALILFENQGRGEFESREIFRQHPLFGHTGFEAVDFNKDGRLDFLVTNGDNGEYPSPTKRYHGLRLYESEVGGGYKLRFFYPLNGAFKAVARDFDGDGDLDIAAVSYFPDYDRSPEESFVYLENRGPGRFTVQTFRECISGRWLTMDVGDVDGDGDDDIVLGNNTQGPGKVPEFLRKDWAAFGGSFVLLRNLWKKREP